MGLLLAGANVLTFALAVQRMSPALVALIFYAYPVLVIAGAHLLRRSRFETFTGLAALTTLLGVALTVGLPAGSVDPLAVFLSLLNALGYAAYILFAESAMRRATAAASIAFVGGLSSILLLAGSLSAGVDLPASGVGLGSLAGLFVSLFFPHVLVLSGIGRLGGSWGSLASCLEVVTTVVATALVLPPRARAGGDRRRRADPPRRGRGTGSQPRSGAVRPAARSEPYEGPDRFGAAVCTGPSADA